ncbi:hypothetical protein AVEN_38274-1 [Araneus ventricosus]|uniref:Uncharacterized protein n=1 Tax=Araneus ventricosus TaxID=182803 RepID=A0A4Y2E4K9_ARAVE|nr:hypothetical protein AVEN_38274-1 [Araneus ventricosus]
MRLESILIGTESYRVEVILFFPSAPAKDCSRRVCLVLDSGFHARICFITESPCGSCAWSGSNVLLLVSHRSAERWILLTLRPNHLTTITFIRSTQNRGASWCFKMGRLEN